MSGYERGGENYQAKNGKQVLILTKIVSRNGSDGRFAILVKGVWGSRAKLEFGTAATAGPNDVTWCERTLRR